MASFLKRFPTRQDVILVGNSGLENEERISVVAIVQSLVGLHDGNHRDALLVF